MKTYQTFMAEDDQEVGNEQLQKAFMMQNMIQLQMDIEGSVDIQDQIKTLAKMNVMLMGQIMLSDEGEQQ